MKSCAFIGGQPADFFFRNNELHPLCQNIKDSLLEQAKARYQNGVRRFYVGGALGTDMWAGEAVLSMKESPEYPGIELVCNIPFEGHNSEWGDDSVTRYERLLSACDDKQAISHSSDRSAYEKRYFQIVDQSQTVIAVCRRVHDKHSDAEAALEYAAKQNKELTVIHPETAEIS